MAKRPYRDKTKEHAWLARKAAAARVRYHAVPGRREKVLARQREAYRSLSKEERRARSERNRFRDVYGITPEDYFRLLSDQFGCCAICFTPPELTRRKRLFVDHDHKTGVVRGLLCDPCNRAIGCVGDSPAKLRSAAAYLEAA